MGFPQLYVGLALYGNNCLAILDAILCVGSSLAHSDCLIFAVPLKVV